MEGESKSETTAGETGEEKKGRVRRGEKNRARWSTLKRKELGVRWRFSIAVVEEKKIFG